MGVNYMVRRIDYEDLIIDLFIFEHLERQSANMSTGKLIFLFEDLLYKKNMVGAHYKMYRYKMGPYNNSISTHLKNLAYNGFLYYRDNYYEKAGKDVKIYQGNPNTKKFLKDIDELIEENSKVFNILIDVLNDFGKMNADELKFFIYSLKETGRSGIPIEKYHIFETILNPDSLIKPIFNFKLDEDWYDTIDIMLNPRVQARLIEGIKNVQSGNLKPL